MATQSSPATQTLHLRLHAPVVEKIDRMAESDKRSRAAELAHFVQTQVEAREIEEKQKRIAEQATRKRYYRKRGNF